jgi:hypothetical protein
MKTGLGMMVVLTVLTPVSDTVPRIDSDRFCTHIETRLDLPQRPRSACLQDEAAARNEVTVLWASAKPASRTQCATTQALAPHPSYASLLTCIQMAEGIVIRPTNPK